MQKLFLASSIENLAVAKHIAKKIKRPQKAAFVLTAGEVEKDKKWIDADRNGLNGAGIKTFDYTITGKTSKDLERDLGGCNLIHVNGGNTFYLLLQAKKSGFDKFIKRQVAKGVIYTGSSAGSIIAGPDIYPAKNIESGSYFKQLADTKAFNLVDFVILPHWGNSFFKKLYLNHRLSFTYKKGHKFILLNDDQYVEVVDGNYKIVDITKD